MINKTMLKIFILSVSLIGANACLAIGISDVLGSESDGTPKLEILTDRVFSSHMGQKGRFAGCQSGDAYLLLDSNVMNDTKPVKIVNSAPATCLTCRVYSIRFRLENTVFDGRVRADSCEPSDGLGGNQAPAGGFCTSQFHYIGPEDSPLSQTRITIDYSSLAGDGRTYLCLEVAG